MTASFPTVAARLALPLALALPALPPVSAMNGGAGEAAGAGGAPSAGQAEASAPAGEPRAAADLAPLLERDERLAFPRVQTAQLLAEAGDADRPPGDRAAALLAIGCMGLELERARLEQAVTAPEELERQAAVLALGELGPRSALFLTRLLDADDPGLSQAAAVALWRTGAPEARRELERRAGTPGTPLADVAAELLGLDRAAPRDAAPAPAALELLLQLRWDAARRYGLVDGRSWSVILLEQLTQDDSFLDFVILPVAAERGSTGIDDHLLEVLLRGRGLARIEAAVIGMPAELERLVLSGVWRPSRDVEWAALVNAIGDAKEEDRMPGSLVLAVAVAPARGRALELLAREGSPQAQSLLEDRLNAPDPTLRAEVAQALGGTGDKRWAAELQRMRKDPHVEVRAAALVAQARLGHGPANTRLDELSTEVRDPDRPMVLDYLLRVGEEQRARFWLERFLPATEGLDRQRILIALARFGDVSSRTELRALLHSGRLQAPLPGAVRALGRGADSRDVELLAELFPRENDLAGNVALARALVRAGNPEGIEVIRAALWREPWNRSVLAAALLVHQRGITGLSDELASPPPGASKRALRRVGFALGEWGGLEQAELLSRRLRAGDPALQGVYLGALCTRTQ